MQVYAVLREDWTTAGGHTVCASQSDAAGAQLIYTSTSNVVEARLVTQSSSAQFLIKVERNAPVCQSVLQHDRRPCGSVFSQQFNHRRSQDFVWGALFLAQKVDDLFLVVALKARLEIYPQI